MAKTQAYAEEFRLAAVKRVEKEGNTTATLRVFAIIQCDREEITFTAIHICPHLIVFCRLGSHAQHVHAFG
jgi:hypothetical protein